MKRIDFFILAVFLLFTFNIPAQSAENSYETGRIQKEFNTAEIPTGITIITSKNLTLNETVIVPQEAILTADVISAQTERRWHKSGFILTKLKWYQDINKDTVINLEDKDIYMIVRKYEPLDKKEAGKTAAEITATTAASFFLPGVDVVYYFAKGVINKEEDKTRFKSGVSNAYENSIFWFWLKGKSIDLDEDSTIAMKLIDKKTALSINSKIEKRNKKSKPD